MARKGRAIKDRLISLLEKMQRNQLKALLFIWIAIGILVTVYFYTNPTKGDIIPGIIKNGQPLYKRGTTDVISFGITIAGALVIYAYGLMKNIWK
ncbi:MAG: hypothetical protein LPK80_04610 [Bacteroidota bacterium]|nr:hypothetical protein [Bacteroidota bacterium]